MKIETSGKSELQRFDNVVRRLLSVPYAELQRRLKKEEKGKGKKKKRKVFKPSAASRASGEDT